MPPWNAYERDTQAYRGITYRTVWAESGWIEITDPEEKEIDRMSGEINTELLMLQVLGAGLVFGAASYLIGPRRQEKEKRRA